jgi:hypothetical protein
MGGTCDAAGIEHAAKSMEQCQSIVEVFGGLDVTKGVESTYMTHGRVGCMYEDLGEEGKVDVMKEDDLYPLCGAKSDRLNSHRVCACTATFGDLGLFDKSMGDCKLADETQNIIKTGTFSNELECQDECARDEDCGAVAWVHPFDDHRRTCNFYSHGHKGDGGNRYILCAVKEEYLSTVGKCAGPEKASPLIATFSPAANVLESCRAHCDASDGCEAFQVADQFLHHSEGSSTKGYCGLFGPKSTGDGQEGYRCYTKALAGVHYHKQSEAA